MKLFTLDAIKEKKLFSKACFVFTLKSNINLTNKKIVLTNKEGATKSLLRHQCLIFLGSKLTDENIFGLKAKIGFSPWTTEAEQTSFIAFAGAAPVSVSLLEAFEENQSANQSLNVSFADDVEGLKEEIAALTLLNSNKDAAIIAKSNELENANKNSNLLVGELNQKITGLNGTITGLTQDAANLRTQNAVQAQAMINKDSALNTALNEKAAYAGRLAAAEGQVASLTASYNQAKANLDQALLKVQQLTSEVNRLNGVIGGLQPKINQLTQIVEAMNANA